MNRDVLAQMAEDELRYDVLPPWAWSRPTGAIERLERNIAAMERLIRENDRALADNVERLERIQQRHRRNKVAFALRLSRLRAKQRLLIQAKRLPIPKRAEGVAR